MNDSKSVRQNVQRIDELVQKIESIADPAIRATAKDLVQSIMDLHGFALEKVLEIISGTGESGMSIIDRLGRDPLVSNVLVLYGLHPEDIETRVARALDRVRPQLRKQGCDVELLGVNDGAVSLRGESGLHTCGSTAKMQRSTLEEAIYDAAPDLASLSIEGFDEKSASGFIALDKLTSSTDTGPLMPINSLASPGPQGAD